MFSTCCVCESQDVEEITQVDLESSIVQYPSEQEKETLNVKQMNADEKKIEAQRLVSLVHTFTRNAIHGIPCRILEHMTGTIHLYTLQLANDLQSFTLKNANDECILIRLINIQEIYTWNDTRTIPKLNNLSKLPGLIHLPIELQQCFLLLELVDDEHYLQRMCLLVHNDLSSNFIETAADAFSKILRMLRIHSKVQSPRAANETPVSL